MKKKSEGPWYYEQLDLGFNYRMNDIQAALGLSQLKRLDDHVKRRHEIAEYYNLKLNNLPLELPWQSPNVFSSYHLYPILIKNNFDNKFQKRVYNELIRNKIQANLHYIPVHRHPFYENLGFKKNDFPVAEKFYTKALSIPMYASLKREQQDYIIDTLKKIIF